MSETSFFSILTLHFASESYSDFVYFCNLVVIVFTCLKKKKARDIHSFLFLFFFFLFYFYSNLWQWLLFFSHPVVSESSWPHGLQHPRPPCPSLSPRVCSSSCSLHQWCCPSLMDISHLILWCPLLLLPSIFLSIRDFYNESSVCIRWPKYWSFSFIISPSREYSGLISLKIDWFDLFAVQGTLRSLHQQYSLKGSILWYSAFFTVQLSQSYLTTGKTRSSELNSPIPIYFSLLIPRMLMFVLTISCLTISNFPWFMDLTFQFPIQYCT